MTPEDNIEPDVPFDSVLCMDSRYVANMHSEHKAFSLFEMFQDRKNIYSKSGDTAEIAITGAIGMNNPMIKSVSYEEINSAVREAFDDEEIKSVKFFFDTPGGAANGMEETAEKIRALTEKKKTESFIKGMCCSAGYRQAIETGFITSGKASFSGSIGAMHVMEDSHEAFKQNGVERIVTSSGVEKGHPIPGTKIPQEVKDRIKGEVTAIANTFFDAVKLRRPLAADKDVFQGASFMGEDALKLGLIDRIGDIELFNNNFNEVNTMAESKPVVDIPERDVDKEISDAKQATESETMERLTALKEAFPEDLTFAFEQFEKGSTVAEAKGAYCDILAERLKTSEANAAKPVVVPEVKAEGAKPVEFTDVTAGKQDFESAVNSVMTEMGCDVVAAMKEVYRRNPAAYQGEFQK